VPVIRSAEASSPHDVLQWRLNKQWAVRNGPWKLLHDPIDSANPEPVKLEDGHWFLANVETDPGERTNCAASHPEIVERLKKLAPAEAPKNRQDP
jgi:arylsulfatase A